MRNRRQPGSNLDAQPVQAADRAVPVARHFTPSELDLDDLAEAIRLLLAPDIGPRIGSNSRPDAHLLSVAPRGTHRVEATQAT